MKNNFDRTNRLIIEVSFQLNYKNKIIGDQKN